MKKNRAMRLAALLLVAVLMSTCGISGTFAKYVSEGTGSDTARVAAWGFGDSSHLTFDLFDDVYGNVDSVNGANVIAPGTGKSTTFKLVYAGTAGTPAPEVAYTVKLAIDPTTTIDPDIANNTNITWEFNGETGLTWADFCDKINNYSENVSPNYLPKIAEGITIGWNWKFHTDASADAFDTMMGNKANLDDMTLVIKFTATQED